MAKAKSDERVYDSDSSDDNEPFKVPPGFIPIKGSSSSSLDKRQLWLIQVPSGLDISKLKKLPLSLDPQVTSVFKGSDSKVYSVFEDVEQELDSQGSAGARLKVLKTSSEGKLQLVSKPISRIMSITQHVEIPDIDIEKVRFPKETVPPVEGLKMRYFPTGYQGENPDDSEVVSSLSETRKRYLESQTPEKKSKKHKSKEHKTKDKDHKHKEHKSHKHKHKE